MNSVLNPEAPEFYPHIESFTQECYSNIARTVRSSNAYPRGNKYVYMTTYPEFQLIRSQFSNRLIGQTNRVVRNEMPRERLSKCMKSNSEIIGECNDLIFDRVEINMERVEEMDTVNEQLQDGMNPGPGTGNGVIIQKIQVGSTMFFGAKNIPRPQLLFKDPVDNSENLWVPKISDKPNNMKPLALSIIYNEKGEAVGYEHPYKVEIDMYEPPQVFLEPDPEPPRFPAPMQETKLTFIQTEYDVDQLVQHLNTVQEIAIDVEHHAYRTYQGITCLIQISTNEGGDFIIDALAVREHIHKLNLSFTDPRKLKVFHGADMDVLWLQRDFGVYIVGLFDTYQAAKILHLTGLSLKHLLHKYCKVEADKKYQLADWRIRPLPEELVEYARQDTHYLLYVWRCMKADLMTANAGGDRLLRSVFNFSKFVCCHTYNKFVIDDSSHLQLYSRSKRKFDTRQMAALKMLYKWRDSQARELDESTSYLLPNHMLLALAGTLPREMQGLYACCSPMPPFVKRNLINIHRMLLSCRELPLEPLGFPMASTSSDRPARRPRISNELKDFHDFSELIRRMKEGPLPLDKPIDPSTVVPDNRQPKCTAMLPNEEDKAETISKLNVHAEMYIPPYYRYRGYLYLTKDQDIRNIENKTARITALAKGDPLIKKEVLEQLELKKQAIENMSKPLTKAQRKRKMSPEKDVIKLQLETEGQDKPSTSGYTNLKFKSKSQKVTPYKYDKSDYKDFSNDREKLHKQAKSNFLNFK